MKIKWEKTTKAQNILNLTTLEEEKEIHNTLFVKPNKIGI